MKTIILCGGGTAGHVMPNIALLPLLKKHYNKIIYIGSFNGIEKDIIKNYKEITYIPITTVKFIRSFNFKNLLIPFKLFKGIKECKQIIKKYKPNIIFSKGGYVSVPVTIAGKLLKIPIVAHESDSSLGLSNKIILKQCKVMCCSFKETAESIKYKGVYTSSPIRESLFKGNKIRAKQICNFNNELPTILIIGGSLGAKAINNVVFNLAEKLTKNFNIIHIVGKNNINKKINISNYYQLEFTPKIEDFFALSDIIISRAGSNAIFEFLALQKPMLLIPLPKGNSRGDQIENAKIFYKNGFCHILNQENLNEKSLLKCINDLYKNKDKIKQKQKQHSKNGNELIVNEIIKYELKN